MNYQGNNNNMEKEQVKPVDKTVVSKKNNRRRPKKVVDRTLQVKQEVPVKTEYKIIPEIKTVTTTYCSRFVNICKKQYRKFISLFKK